MNKRRVKLTKRKPISTDFMKFWPLALMLGSVISTSAVNYYRVEQLEKNLDRRSTWVERIDTDVNSLKVEVARLKP